jgi:uracil-DNA glycosylase
MSLIPENAHPSWRGFLKPDIVSILDGIEQRIGDDVNPEKSRILNFLTTDLDGTKVVIIGQDPYPERGVATGRAFEVGTLESWNQPFRQVSLKNIMRLIYRTYNRIGRYSDIPAYSRVSEEIASGKFDVADPQTLFKCWERQGVLLLNIWLSCAPNRPGTHRSLWQPFSERLLEHISSKNPGLHWFLWGKSAISCKPFIKSGILHECRHPMMCSESYDDDFLKSDCMENTKNLVNWLGK